MRAVVQRVMKASVNVGDEVVGSIGKGLCVLVGISRDDKPGDIAWMVRKILNLRVFEDDEGKRWSQSVMDKQFEVLCVSQFTLYSVLKGNKPDFHCSMGGEQSQAFYQAFLQEMKKAYKPEHIRDGRFGAMMQVNIQNDGPVTISLESPNKAPGNGDLQASHGEKRSHENSDQETGPSHHHHDPEGPVELHIETTYGRLAGIERF